MPDSRIITGASDAQRAPTLYGPSRSATGIGEAVTLSRQPQPLQCLSSAGRPSPERWDPALTSRAMLHECTSGADGLPNKPLERAGMNAARPSESASAGRSAPSRLKAMPEQNCRPLILQVSWRRMILLLTSGALLLSAVIVLAFGDAALERLHVALALGFGGVFGAAILLFVLLTVADRRLWQAALNAGLSKLRGVHHD